MSLRQSNIPGSGTKQKIPENKPLVDKIKLNFRGKKILAVVPNGDFEKVNASLRQEICSAIDSGSVMVCPSSITGENLHIFQADVLLLVGCKSEDLPIHTLIKFRSRNPDAVIIWSNKRKEHPGGNYVGHYIPMPDATPVENMLKVSRFVMDRRESPAQENRL